MTRLNNNEFECLENHLGNCRGEITRQASASGLTMIERCQKHWNDSYRLQDEINRRYPDSDIPPADFDPFYAGERWNEDDPW